MALKGVSVRGCGGFPAADLGDLLDVRNGADGAVEACGTQRATDYSTELDNYVRCVRKRAKTLGSMWLIGGGP